MQLMELRGWIASLPGSPLPTQAAETAGIDASTMSRQLKRGAISAENVILLARAHGANAVDALVDHGYLNPSDAAGAGVALALESATNRELLAEVVRRSDPNAKLLLRGGDGAITPKGKHLKSSNESQPAAADAAARKTAAELKQNRRIDDAK